MKALFVAVMLLLVPSLVLASTWLVKPDGSGNFPTIQAAVNAAASGDIILLTDGTFAGPGNRDISITKKLTISSRDGNPDSCIIDCQSAGRGFYYLLLSSGGIIRDLTIINGYATHGAGIFATGGAPEIFNCYISFCRATNSGGGIYLSYVATTTAIRNCGIVGNTATVGGGICLESASALVNECHIIDNQAMTGGGVYCAGGEPRLEWSLIAGNTADYGGGINGYYASPTIVNCTIVQNSGHGISAGSGSWHIGSTIIASNAGFGIYNPVSVILTCSDIWGNLSGDWVGAIAGQLGVPGNICQDPMFCLPEYTIDVSSPCTVDNSQGCGLIGALGVGCERPTKAEGATWGRLKAMYK